MGLPETGVKLVAENERGFLGAMSRAAGGVDEFQKGAERASVGTIALGTAVGNLITGGLSMIANTAIQAGQALTGFVGQGIQEAAALEAQMSGIAAVTGASAEEMDALQGLIMDLGLNPNLTVSTVQAAQAIEMLGKNGVSVTEILDGMALSTVQLANSTGADFATAADLATDTMSLFGNQGVNMTDAVNGITGVVNASKFGINDYALALANGGATAAALGVELSDFNSLLTGISPSFTSGATAGTAMKNMLLRLSPATNKAEDAMMSLGLITEDGANVFYNTDGTMKSMSQVAAILSGSLSGLTEQQKATTLKTIFGNDAMEAVLATMTAGAPLYEDAATAAAELGLSFDEATAFIEAGGNSIALASLQMQQVDAADSAATRVDNFAGAMDILGGIIEGVRIQIGTKFLPVLTQLAQKAGEFIEANAGPIIDFFSIFAGAVANAASAMIEGAGPLTVFTGFLSDMGTNQSVIDFVMSLAASIQDFITKVVSFVSEHKESFIGALKGIGAVLAGAAIASTIASIAGAIASLFTPIGLIIAGAALLGAAWENNWGGIQEKTQAVIDFLQPYILNGITAIKTFWSENGDSILTKAGETWEGIKTAVQNALTFIRDGIIVPIATGIATFWSEHGEAIKASAAKIWEAIKTGINDKLLNIKAIFDAFKLAFEGDWKGFGEKLREIWDRKWTAIKEFWGTWGTNMLTSFSTFITDVIKKFEETDWKAVGTAILQGIANGITNGIKIINDAATAAAEAALEAAKGFLGIESPSKLFTGIGLNIGEGMALGIAQSAQGVATAAAGLGQSAAIATPASASQILNRNTTNNISKTINFTGNYSSQPTITDTDTLTRVMASL